MKLVLKRDVLKFFPILKANIYKPVYHNQRGFFIDRDGEGRLYFKQASSNYSCKLGMRIPEKFILNFSYDTSDIFPIFIQNSILSSLFQNSKILTIKSTASKIIFSGGGRSSYSFHTPIYFNPEYIKFSDTFENLFKYICSFNSKEFLYYIQKALNFIDHIDLRCDGLYLVSMHGHIKLVGTNGKMLIKTEMGGYHYKDFSFFIPSEMASNLCKIFGTSEDIHLHTYEDKYLKFEDNKNSFLFRIQEESPLNIENLIDMLYRDVLLERSVFYINRANLLNKTRFLSSVQRPTKSLKQEINLTINKNNLKIDCSENSISSTAYIKIFKSIGSFPLVLKLSPFYLLKILESSKSVELCFIISDINKPIYITSSIDTEDYNTLFFLCPRRSDL